MIYESDFHVMLLSNAELVLSFPASTISSPFISVSANTVAYTGIFLGNSVSSGNYTDLCLKRTI